ncbi:uncharacterized protein [Gossypium hirsutum]|uniref:Uncharacterized protein isoform X3 n=1 Tax=Gossypium hirsutum TaxID=3635 RepID=A0ABM2ZH13_GOSHI|nr:uncharacterized protein LOC107894721 isoform X3 [Gossypium hirsutum]
MWDFQGNWVLGFNINVEKFNINVVKSGCKCCSVIQELLPVLPGISAWVLPELIFVGTFVGLQELLFIFVGIFNVTTLFNCVYTCIADLDII